MPNTRKVVIVVTVVILGAVGFWYFFNSNNTVENEQVQNLDNTNQVELPHHPDIPDGWLIYKDEELGYAFAYPPDWELVVGTARNGIESGRNKQTIIQNDSAIIRVDPLGRTGADEMRVEEKKSMQINEIHWSHYISADYHRFIDTEGKIVFKSDSQSFPGQEDQLSALRNFRVHVNLETASTELERQKAVETAIKILSTLSN